MLCVLYIVCFSAFAYVVYYAQTLTMHRAFLRVIVTIYVSYVMHHYVIYEYIGSSFCAVHQSLPESESVCDTRAASSKQRDEHEWVQSVRAAPVVLSTCKPEALHIYMYMYMYIHSSEPPPHVMCPALVVCASIWVC